MQMDSTTVQLIQVLEKTVSPDKNELEAAQNFLEQAAQTNLHEFVQRLSGVLVTAAASAVSRMAAGLQLKNQLTSKDPALKSQYQQRWLAIPAETREYIKKNILGALGTETNRPSAAAQCVAYVAVAELPVGQWNDLIPLLVSNVANPNSTEMMKEATLETIGYICQEIESEVLESQSNQILTAIIHGMKGSNTSNHVRLAATSALFNSLEFTKGNFEIESERNFIMEVVCEATQSSHTQVRVAALQCLVKIMSLYYQYMEPYMAPALFPITLEAMKSDIDEVALQGIEFWSNVSDEEVDLSMEEGEASEGGRPPVKVSRHYAKGALQYLVPVLVQKLTKQEEFDDEDDWNPSKSAGVCLMLLSSCCEEAIVPYVLPFVKANIKSPDWRFRDAALMAFGSILGGLEPSTLKPLVEQAMPTLIELMYDNSVVVRDTAAWTFGRICEIIPGAAINETYLKPLLESLVNGLKAEPRVAANVCWAFTGLAEASYESTETAADKQPETYCMSQYFDFIVQRLLETTDRPDGAQANLRSAAYEALMEMVKNSPRDCYVTVQRTTMVILQRLQQVLQMETHIQSHSDRAQYNDLQSLLCATLQSVLRKVTPEDAPQISDAIMTALLSMFNSNSCKSGGVQEDALMAVSTLVEVLGEGFLKYMDAFKPFLCLGLKNHAEYQVCVTAVGLTGDICRALKSKILPYCDEIMTLLLENLGNNSVHRSVKPQILAVFGDIALSIGPEFKKYLDVVLQTLAQASQANVDRLDYDMIDYLNELREGILDAYTGIVQGLKGDGMTPNPDVNLLEPHVPFMIQFITSIARDREHSDGNVAASAGLIGDLVTVFGVTLLPMIDTEPIMDLLTKGRRSRTNKTKAVSAWAAKEIRRLKNNLNAPSSWCAPRGCNRLLCGSVGRRDARNAGGTREERGRNAGGRTKSAEVGIEKRGLPAVSVVRKRPRTPSMHPPDDNASSDGNGKPRAPEDDDGFDLDDLLPTVGEFGRYQKQLLWFVCLPACLPCGFCAFNQLFMADTPPHWCKVPGLEGLDPSGRRRLAIPSQVHDERPYAPRSRQTRVRPSYPPIVLASPPPSHSRSPIAETPILDANGTFSQCTRYDVDWTDPGITTVDPPLEPNSSWPVVPCDHGWEYDMSEVVSSIVVDFDLVCDYAIYPTVGLVALNTGGPIGVYLFGTLNDRIGRRLSFFTCLATLITGGFLTSISNSFWTWAVTRMIVGLTIPAIYQIPFIISLELVGPNYRSFVTVMTCTFYTMGLCMLAGVTYLIRDWKTLAITTSAPFLLYFLYWWFLPESPRWLLAKGRLEEANRILERLARVNGKELPSSFTQKLRQRMTMSRSKSEEERLRNGPGVLSLFKTPNMRLKTCLITLNWFANNMVYVGLSYYGPALGNEEHLSFLFSSFAEIPSYLACWIVMDRWGRRWPLCLCMVLAGVSCIATVLLPSDAVIPTLILFLLSKSAISASFLIIYPFAGELYPTQLRGVAIGFSAYISGLGLIIIPFVTYLGRDNLVLPLVILGVVSVIGGLSGLRLPETLHHRLPQTVEEGELFGKDWTCADCIRCVPTKPSSTTTSYEDLSVRDTVEMHEVPEEPRPEEQRSAAAVRRLVRQSSVMDTQRDSDGSIKMTYWF